MKMVSRDSTEIAGVIAGLVGRLLSCESSVSSRGDNLASLRHIVQHRFRSMQIRSLPMVGIPGAQATNMRWDLRGKCLKWGQRCGFFMERVKLETYFK